MSSPKMLELELASLSCI